MSSVQYENDSASLHLSCYNGRSLPNVAPEDVGNSAALMSLATRLVCDAKSLTSLSSQYLARSRELMDKSRREIGGS